MRVSLNVSFIVVIVVRVAPVSVRNGGAPPLRHDNRAEIYMPFGPRASAAQHIQEGSACVSCDSHHDTSYRRVSR